MIVHLFQTLWKCYNQTLKMFNKNHGIVSIHTIKNTQNVTWNNEIPSELMLCLLVMYY